jgi:cytochrome c biogenesis protein CcmG, thiol:disulfide interchange protein DsbE
MDGGTTYLRSKRSLGGVITASVVVALLVLTGFGLRNGSVLQDGFAPNFTLPLFDDGEFRLSELRGRVVVVNFWASWCAPCREEAPALESVWQEYRDEGVAFVGVAVRDLRSKAVDFAENVDMTFPIGSDQQGQIANAYRITGIPETFVVAADGRIAAHFIGPVTKEMLGATLDELLQK